MSFTPELCLDRVEQCLDRALVDDIDLERRVAVAVERAGGPARFDDIQIGQRDRVPVARQRTRSGFANAAAGAGNDRNPFHLGPPIARAHHSFGCGTVEGIRCAIAGSSSLTAALQPRFCGPRVRRGVALRGGAGCRLKNPEAIALRKAADYSPAASAERSAARLAHQSGGLGVPSSNLGAPTNKAPKNKGFLQVATASERARTPNEMQQKSRNRCKRSRKKSRT